LKLVAKRQKIVLQSKASQIAKIAATQQAQTKAKGDKPSELKNNSESLTR
jgi:hypothetical protein